MGRDLWSWLRTILLLANFVFAIAAAGFVLAVWLAPESLSFPAHGEPGVLRIDMRSGERGIGLVALLAGIMLICDVLWIVYGGVPKQSYDHVISHVDGGTVKVARDALESGLRVSGESLSEVSRLRISVAVIGKNKRVVVRAQFQSPDGVSIQVAGQRLRDALRRRFEEMVCLSDGPRLDIEVEFVGFAGRLKAAATDDRRPQVEPDDPFTGPRYPIDGEPWKDD